MKTLDNCCGVFLPRYSHSLSGVSSLLVCRSQVYQRTFLSVESSTIKRKELQWFPNTLLACTSSGTLKSTAQHNRAKQQVHKGLITTAVAGNSASKQLLTNLVFFSKTELSKVGTSFFFNAENFKLWVKWTNRMYYPWLHIYIWSKVRWGPIIPSTEKSLALRFKYAQIKQYFYDYLVCCAHEKYMLKYIGQSISW